MSLRISVLTIGDELLSGEIADTNTAAMARRLEASGYRVRESLTVGDNEPDIGEALLALVARNDVVLVSGGLGPTADDLTARAAARAFERRLVLNDEALAAIRDHFRRLQRPMDPRNEKQALLPQKTNLLANRKGTAPGFVIRHNGREIFFLPGVPAEMTDMLEAEVLPKLIERSAGAPRQERILKVFGLSEAKVETLLAERELPPGVRLAFGLDFPLVLVKLRAEGEDAEALLDRAELEARRALDDFVVAIGDQSLAGNVARQLSAAGLTLAVAESCTGGLIASWLTEIPGASAFLERSAVTYANSAKADWLGVPAAVLETHGAVSAPCALAMAKGMRRAAASDLAVAVTGIAGPTGGTPQKPVGTVYIALAAADQEQARGYRFTGDRWQIRRLAAHMALEWVRRYLAARPTITDS